MVTHKNTTKKAFLLYGDTEHNTDILYLGKTFVPDPFLVLTIKGQSIAWLNALEYNRVCRESQFTETRSLEAELKKAEKQLGKKQPQLQHLIELAIQEHSIETLTVQRDFPAWLYEKLLKLNVTIEVAESSIFPERAIKTKEEAEAIKEGNQASAAGFACVENIIKGSTIKKDKLYYKNQLLTSEYLKAQIEITCLERGALSLETIVACGEQACEPHNPGSGPIYANSLIIVDIFPRIQATHYHGDMTRTFLKGKASDAEYQLVLTVQEAQQKAIQVVRANISSNTIHNAAAEHFIKKGYKTEIINGTYQGFFHGTGHGLGLDVHEAPRVSKTEERLKEGHVVTIEPGLYYPGLGGCRIEDVFWVKKDGHVMLSDYHYHWEFS